MSNQAVLEKCTNQDFVVNMFHTLSHHKDEDLFYMQLLIYAFYITDTKTGSEDTKFLDQYMLWKSAVQQGKQICNSS